MSLMREVKYALRAFGRAPGYAAAVVMTLGLGIGANAAIFSVVRGVLLRPLPNRDEGRLLYLRQSAPGIREENSRFSVPEIADYRSRVRSLEKIGEFSTITFTLVGLGEPRQVRAGVVDGQYFEAMGLRPVLGRLLGPSDDGPSAPGAAILTHRFWLTALGGDTGVVGKTIRLGTRQATVVGVVEPSVPYPTETELIANVVTSPHHLGATMTTDRLHRMTEIFGRMKPGADLETVRTELRTVQAALRSEYRESYDPKADFRIEAVRFRDQITSRARSILLILLAAAGLIFVIATSNAANLVLARALRREPELAVRGALGATAGNLRRVLLVECLLLALGGAAASAAIAGPAVRVLALYAARFTVRAHEVTVDGTVLWVSVALSLVAGVLFAFIPSLPKPDPGRAGSRVAGGARRGQRLFAVIQVAASFILLVGAGLLVRTLLALQAVTPGFELENVLAVNVPVTSYGRTPVQVRGFYDEVRRRVAELPGVRGVAIGSTVPWRDAQNLGVDLAFTIEGAAREAGDQSRAKFRSVSPAFFATLGIPIVSGRDFTDGDRLGNERVVIVNEALARRLLPGQDIVGRSLRWSDERMRFTGISVDARRIVGVAADVRDEGFDASPLMTVYHPFQQELVGGRLFVHAAGDPYRLVPPITRIVRELAADQPVERASTLADIRTEVLAPSRLNALVISGFAVVALAVAIVGVAGVLAFSVSGRTREFGIRMAIGARPRDILASVLLEGAAIAGIGLALGVGAGYAMERLVRGFLNELRAGDPATLGLAALLLALAAIGASMVPALRAARVDVVQALRAD